MRKSILLVDNHDSFTWNVVRLVEENSDFRVVVRPNDAVRLRSVAHFEKIIFSPGAGVPAQIPVMREILERFQAEKSILGICLGHQAIAETYGWPLVNLSEVFHGQRADVQVLDASERLFRGLPERFSAGLYHSWAAVPPPEPAPLRLTAVSAAGVAMAIAHEKFDVRGVQFHPESFLSAAVGGALIRNWLDERMT